MYLNANRSHVRYDRSQFLVDHGFQRTASTSLHMFQPLAFTADRALHRDCGVVRGPAQLGPSVSRPTSAAKDEAAELTSPQRWTVVIAIGLLHLGAAGWLLRPAMNPVPPPSRETALRVDWIAAVEPAGSPTQAPAALPTPAQALVRPVRSSPVAPVALLSVSARSPATVSVVPPDAQAARAAADDAPTRPTEASAASHAVASSSVTSAEDEIVVPASPPAPKDLPAESVQYLVPPVPVYPRLSRRQGETGRVLVRVYIDEAGLPRTVQLSASSGHARLDDAARQAVQQARFKPYAENGRPMGGWALIPLTFDLEKSP